MKSHRTLYAEGDALQRCFASAERRAVECISRDVAKARPVASWYLRLRDPRGPRSDVGIGARRDRDPAGSTMTSARRADEVSRWILAEASPVALPDGRWDKMVYGVRDCEEFLATR